MGGAFEGPRLSGYTAHTYVICISRVLDVFGEQAVVPLVRGPDFVVHVRLRALHRSPVFTPLECVDQGTAFDGSRPFVPA